MRSRYFRYFTYIEPIIRAPLVKTYGTLIMTIVLLIIFVLFAIKPTIETIFLLLKDLENQKSTLAQLKKKRGDLTLAIKNYNSLDSNILSSIETSIPKSTRIDQLVTSLENAASIPEASISALQFQPITIEPPANVTSNALTEISFTFNIEGSYQNLMIILNNLRQSPRLISMDKVLFSKLSTSSLLLMSISGKAYYIK